MQCTIIEFELILTSHPVGLTYVEHALNYGNKWP